MSHFVDRLVEAVRVKKNPLCVGLDPRWNSLPLGLRKKYWDGSLSGVARAFEAFCSRVLDLVEPIAPVIKPQSAFFEACGPDGMRVLQRLLHSARERNLITILDGKRNDISSTAAAYADASFAGVSMDGTTFPVWNADAVTVNPYLGKDGIEPFLTSARQAARPRGLFVLVRNSNRGAGQFQDLQSNGQPLYQHVARAVAEWGDENRGAHGFGDVGAVVGATHPAELAILRRLVPNVWFLVPGFGAQGGAVADVADAFRGDGLGAIVNSSRGITFPFQPDDPDWEQAIVNASRRTAGELASVMLPA